MQKEEKRKQKRSRKEKEHKQVYEEVRSNSMDIKMFLQRRNLEGEVMSRTKEVDLILFYFLFLFLFSFQFIFFYSIFRTRVRVRVARSCCHTAGHIR